MFKITIENLNNCILESTASNKNFLQIFALHNIDWMHACGGKGRCTTCKILVTSGNENISPPTETEKKYMEKGLLKNGERLACQSNPGGDVRLKVPSKYKLPHLEYSD